MQKRIVFDYRPDSQEASTKGTAYHCVEVTNSVEPDPGTWFTKEAVNEIFVEGSTWIVTIKL